MTYNVFGGTLNLAQSINVDKETWPGFKIILQSDVLDWSQTLPSVSSSVRQLGLSRQRWSPSEQSSGAGCRRRGGTVVLPAWRSRCCCLGRRAAASGDVTASVMEDCKAMRRNSDQKVTDTKWPQRHVLNISVISTNSHVTARCTNNKHWQTAFDPRGSFFDDR